MRRYQALSRCRLGDEIVLSLLAAKHAERLFELTDRNRRQLRRWLPWVDAAKSARASRLFIDSALKQNRRKDGFHCGIWFRGALAGVIGLHRIDWPNRTAAIGYWLGAGFQGRGLMTRSCAALVAHCFSKLGLNRVEIRCATANVRSRKIPQRLGFKKEGVLRGAGIDISGLRLNTSGA